LDGRRHRLAKALASAASYPAHSRLQSHQIVLGGHPVDPRDRGAGLAGVDQGLDLMPLLGGRRAHM